MAEITNVIMNNKEKMEECIKNLLLLFQRRGYFNTDNSNKIKSIMDELLDKNTSIIKSDKMKIMIYYNDVELKNISTGSDIDDMLSKNLDTHKFLIIGKMTQKKIYKQITSDYKNAEIFQIHEMLEDLPSKTFIPEHILLTKDEVEEIKKYYEIENMPHIYNTDIMSRYYGAKVGDVFRIKRYNLNSGISTYYRKVVNDGSIYFI